MPEPGDKGEPATDELAFSLLRVGLGLSVFVAALGLAQALVGGLGTHPTRRVLIGLALVAFSIAAFVLSRRLWAVLRDHRAVVLPVAACQLAAAAVDELPNGPYFAYCLTSVGVAVTVGGPRFVWACVGVLDTGYLVAVLADQSVTALDRSGDLTSVLGALIAPPAAAFILLRLGKLYKDFDEGLAQTLLGVRDGRIAVASPKLLAALQEFPALPPPAREPQYRYSDLSAKELRLAEALIQFATSEDIATALSYSKSSIDKQIADLMDKTGACTRSHLAALTGLPDWPRTTSNGL